MKENYPKYIKSLDSPHIYQLQDDGTYKQLPSNFEDRVIDLLEKILKKLDDKQ